MTEVERLRKTLSKSGIVYNTRVQLLVEFEAAVRTEERTAQGERTSQLVEAMIAAESFTHDPFEDPVEVVPVEFVRQVVADAREATP